MYKFMITDKGRLLVRINENYGCYTEADGSFLRSVPDIQTEWEWAKEKFKNKEENSLSNKIEESLTKQLQYVAEYKNSLQLN